MKTLSKLICAVIFTAFPTSVFAHHSFQATFRADAKITVEGVVTDFRFKNPHVLVFLDVTNDDGSITNWMSEGAAATNMRRRGWSRDTLKPGDLIQITGDSTRDGSPMVSIESVNVLDPDSRAVIVALGSDRALEDQVQSVDTIPLALADGRPNLTGFWPNNPPGPRGRPRPPPIPFNEKGLALQATNQKADDPQVFCDAPGMVRQVAMTPHPFRITQYEDRVVFDYEEYGGHREVYFGDSIPAAGIKTHLGDSVARYEGDALIIETVNLLSNPVSPDGHRLSDQMTVVETYRRVADLANGSALQLEVVVTDPVYLSEPLVWPKGKVYAASYEMIGQDCRQPLRERAVVNPVMSFFLTSHGPGDGANLGGLKGADAHCEALAQTVSAGGRDWRAYLSTTGEGGVDARDRIGKGPWYNAKGDLVARDVAQLHSDENNVTKASVVDERGQAVNGRGDTPNRHDILTGSMLDGTAANTDGDASCSNWTSNEEGSALVGHFDRIGGGQNPTSWNSAHGSRGCSQENLQGTGGDGLFYCFAGK